MTVSCVDCRKQFLEKYSQKFQLKEHHLAGSRWRFGLRESYCFEMFQVMLTAWVVTLTDCRLLFGLFFPRMTMRLAMV